MFDNQKEAGIVSKQWLRNGLEEWNILRPVVWAECRDNPVCYGVSLGVPRFARPLYLYTKLRRLSNVKNPQVANPLEGVKATAIRENNNVKQPCITCQLSFGFISFPIIGNCAEYDVIGNVHPKLLETEQWQECEAACQQHLNAFNTMMRDKRIHNNMSPADQKDIGPILKRYFENIRTDPNRPKVLKYQWKSEAIGGFELTALEEWWKP